LKLILKIIYSSKILNILIMIKELKINSIEEIYSEMKLIGEGSYGLVYKATNK